MVPGQHKQRRDLFISIEVEMEARGIPVKLKCEWMGNPPGTIMTLPRRIAENLFQRDTASIFIPESQAEVRDNLKKMMRRTTPKV
jgi:hypothetical protein